MDRLHWQGISHRYTKFSQPQHTLDTANSELPWTQAYLVQGMHNPHLANYPILLNCPDNVGKDNAFRVLAYLLAF
ncbi:hypothetical protein BCV12_011100 [Vibrio cyclitrophicus]|uniref:hypothetical protein n=1 Tax=Vibrio cyclitrophicus TaxID=47951 RepID=UPI0038B4F05D